MKISIHIRSVSANNEIAQFVRKDIGVIKGKYTEIQPQETIFYDPEVSHHRTQLLEQMRQHPNGYNKLTLETTRTYNY